jgi:hypothetical protein
LHHHKTPLVHRPAAAGQSLQHNKDEFSAERFFKYNWKIGNRPQNWGIGQEKIPMHLSPGRQLAAAACRLCGIRVRAVCRWADFVFVS